MTKSEYIRLLRELSAARGYRRKGSLFWRSKDELTALMHVQTSKWSTGWYVNFGFTPTRMVGPFPSGPEYWGWAQRAEDFHGPHQEAFQSLAEGDDRSIIERDAVAQAIEWMLRWLDERLDSPDVLRREVLDAVGNEWGIMPDWARGELRERSEYFSDGGPRG